MTQQERPRVVSKADWIEARKQLLGKEKALTRARDALSAQRRELPWVKVDKLYVFDTLIGHKTLADLFSGRSQLIVYHFMLGPGWKEGCVGCSFSADHMEGTLVHLENHDVTLVMVSRAPLAEIEAFRQRMGWCFRWVSSFGSDFNYDYHVSFTRDELEKGAGYYNYRTAPLSIEELHGLSVFYKDSHGDIFHTYSCYARGAETLLATYALLDLTPKGRNETGANGDMTDWVRHHDRYEAGGFVDATGHYHAEPERGDCCAPPQNQAQTQTKSGEKR